MWNNQNVTLQTIINDTHKNTKFTLKIETTILPVAPFTNMV